VKITKDSIVVEKIRAINKGNLKGFAKIKVAGIVIDDIRIVQQRDQQPWISGPQREYEYHGERKFAPIVSFDDDTKNVIQDVVLEAWRRS